MQLGAAMADDHLVLGVGWIIIQLVLDSEFGLRAGEKEVDHGANMRAHDARDHDLAQGCEPP